MRRRPNGFTLIELLVVVAIIAILAAILFPVFINAKERASQTKCLGNLRQLAMAFRAYADDNDGGFPSLSRYVDYQTRRISPPPPDWCGSDAAVVGCLVRPEKGSLWRYVKNREVYLCPVDRGIPATAIQGSPKDYAISYNVNYQLHFAKIDSGTAGRAGKVLMLIQERRKSINDGYFAWGNNYDLPSKIHYDGTTACYCDGHAKWVNVRELERQWTAGDWKVSR